MHFGERGCMYPILIWICLLQNTHNAFEMKDESSSPQWEKQGTSKALGITSNEEVEAQEHQRINSEDANKRGMSKKSDIADKQGEELDEREEPNIS